MKTMASACSEVYECDKVNQTAMTVCSSNSSNDEETENRDSMSHSTQADSEENVECEIIAPEGNSSSNTSNASLSTESLNENGTENELPSVHGESDPSENGIELLVTQMNLCREMINPTVQNIEPQIQAEASRNLKRKEQSPLPISEECGGKRRKVSYRIGVNSTTIRFTCLENEEQRETGPQVLT